MAAELAPIERKTAMSAFFDLTNIIIDETILKAATNIITKRFPRERLKALALNTNTEFNVVSLSP